MLIGCGGAAFTVVFDTYQMNSVCETITFTTIKIPRHRPRCKRQIILALSFCSLFTKPCNRFVRAGVNLDGDLSKIKIETPDRLSFLVKS